ncbi:ABC transporter ATP-binding protein [Actinomadura sediminis]|uniref:ABC transporter ATP-binding protein n=1 Tax=Actinomadura sediminis TaxID=1038904 RepID=A0ABW3EVN7_9ACTN
MNAVVRLLPIIAERRGAFLGTVLASLGAQLAVLGLALLLAHLTGTVSAAAGGGPLGEPALWAAGLAGLAVTAAACTWLEAHCSHDLAYSLIGMLRGRVFDALRRSVPDRADARRSGDLGAVAMADAESLEWLYAHTVAQTLTAGAVLTVTTAVSLLVNPALLLVWVPLLAAAVAIPWTMSGISARQARRLSGHRAALRADLVETVQGLRELAAADAVGRRRAHLADVARAVAGGEARPASRIGAERALGDLTLSATAIGALAVTAAGVGELPASAVPLAFTVAVAALGPAAQLTDLLRNAGALREAARRIVAVLDRPQTAPEPGVPCRADPDPSEGLRFENVAFRYAPEEPPVLDGFDLHVAPGETVALMGPSGSGKSTSARLALRLWDPDTGSVRVGGIDLRDLPDARLRALVGAVPQDARLVSGTLARNIRLAAPDASDDAVRRAAADAGLLSPAAGLPDGLATVVGDGGAGVSGGQRARVSIARALLTDPRVLVLDEPTASLDPGAEAAFGELLARPSRRATLVITHRPDTAAFCDRIVELAPGADAPPGE